MLFARMTLNVPLTAALLSSVTSADVPIWSKLESGYVPNIQEIFHILHNHLNINQADGAAAAGFSSP